VKQVAQLSHRDRDAGWVSFGQKTGTGMQYSADIIGLSSTTVSFVSKAVEFGEKRQNKGYYAVQGRSMSSRTVSIESPYTTSYY